MYVCLCHNVTEKDIERSVQRGARSLRHLQDELKVATCCGSCADYAQQCLERSRDQGRMAALEKNTG